MTTVAVFGGSFSPFHIGHLEVAKGILEQKLADEVWLMPCKKNPLKDSDTLISDSRRLKMLEDAVNYTNQAGFEGKIKISDLELRMPVPSFTCATLEKLKKENPDIKFRIAVGGDSYLNFESWKNWEWIEKNFEPIVYPRPGYEINVVRPGWTLLKDVAVHDVSSTQIRARLAKGEETIHEMPWLYKWIK